MKFYSVKIGRAPGIYSTWAECEKQVKGFSGAVYKSFPTRKEAEAFLSASSSLLEKKTLPPLEKKTLPPLEKKTPLEKKMLPPLEKKTLPLLQNEKKKIIEVFTDGSHFKHVADSDVGMGIFAIFDGKEFKYSGSCDKDFLKEYGIQEGVKISNPTGEMGAFTEALKRIYLSEKTGKDLSEYTFLFKIDYEGVGKWMSGQWKCKEEYIRKIKEKADFYVSHIKAKIEIEYVPAHSGDYGNDEADKLAKSNQCFDTFSELFNFL